MITLTRKLKKDTSNEVSSKRGLIRDRLLIKEVQEMEQNTPNTCKVYFSDVNILSEFTLTISPEEGFWKDGKFKFSVIVPEEYNMTVTLCFFVVALVQWKMKIMRLCLKWWVCMGELFELKHYFHFVPCPNNLSNSLKKKKQFLFLMCTYSHQK